MKSRHKIVVFSLIAGLLLFGVPFHELYSRSLVVIGIFIFSMIILKILYRRNFAIEMKEKVETLNTIAQAAKDAIIMMDHQGLISFWNPAAENIFGYSTDEAMGKELHELLAPRQYREAYQEGCSRFEGKGEGAALGRTLELTAVRKGGEEFPVELSLSALQLKGKWHATGIIRDITERKKSEAELQTHREQLKNLVEERTEELEAVNEQLRKEILDRTRTEEELYRSESFLGTIFDSIHDPFSIVDRDYRIVKFNDAYARMRNKQAKDILGKKCYEVLQNRESVCEECVVEKTFLSADPCAKEKPVTLPDGAEVWSEIYTYPIFGLDKGVSHVIEYIRDITDRRKTDEEKTQLIKKLDYLSTTDSLTGLFNRRALNDILNREIDRAKRYGSGLSLILCDVDRFKKINDTCGHRAGDRALQAVSETLQKTLRKADVLGRYGGDEFMIILPETSLPGAESLAEKIRTAVTKIDLELPGKNRIRLSLSIGVTSCCVTAEDIDTLVARADAGLYTSKEKGRNKVSAVENSTPDRIQNPTQDATA
jgi:diguanylate cyclase (GGDEF)-like protein/PAS domain S-box-containing protein